LSKVAVAVANAINVKGIYGEPHLHYIIYRERAARATGSTSLCAWPSRLC